MARGSAARALLILVIGAACVAPHGGLLVSGAEDANAAPKDAAAPAEPASAAKPVKGKPARTEPDDVPLDEFDDLDQWEKKASPPVEQAAEEPQEVETEAEPEANAEPAKANKAGDKSGGAKKKKKGAKKAQVAKQQQAPPKKVPKAPRTYHAEIFFVMVMVVYFINFVIGRSTNHKIAQFMESEMKDVMLENFSQTVDSSGESLIVESPFEYALYGSGRKHCRRMTVFATLPERQNLLKVLQNFMAPTEPDTIEISIEMTPEAFQGFVFAICPAKLSKIIKARKHDLNAFSKKLAGTSWGLSQSLSIMCDKPEVANQLLKRDIKDFLNNNGEYLQLLHFSDFYLKPDESPYNQDTPAERLTKAVDNRQHMLYMRFQLYIGQPDCPDLKELAKTAVNFIDAVANIRLSPADKKEAERKREQFTANITRESPKEKERKAMERKFELAKKEKERYEAMPEGDPARVRWERQQEKKRMKKKQPNMKRMR